MTLKFRLKSSLKLGLKLRLFGIRISLKSRLKFRMKSRLKLRLKSRLKFRIKSRLKLRLKSRLKLRLIFFFRSRLWVSLLRSLWFTGSLIIYSRSIDRLIFRFLLRLIIQIQNIRLHFYFMFFIIPPSYIVFFIIPPSYIVFS